MLGLRFKQDPAVGKRFETLTRELGDAFIRVGFEGRRHAKLTEHRQQEGVDRVLAFLDERSCTPRSLRRGNPTRRVCHHQAVEV